MSKGVGSGYGWVMNTAVWEKAKLFDVCLIGGGDFQMWKSVFHEYLEESAVFRGETYSAAFSHYRREWARTWSQAIELKVGCAKNVKVNVMSHGRMSDRRYVDRNTILRESQFDPDSHIRRDEAGLPVWTEAAPPSMQRGIRSYSTGRREDIGMGKT